MCEQHCQCQVHSFFPKTIRISTMHVLRMIITETEETHGLRINFVLCFSTLIFYNKLKIENLLLPVETRSLNAQHPYTKPHAQLASRSCSSTPLPPCEILSKFSIHIPYPITRLPHRYHFLISLHQTRELHVLPTSILTQLSSLLGQRFFTNTITRIDQ